MKTRDWMSRCPYRIGSRMRQVYSVLARAQGKPLGIKEIARWAKVPFRTVVNALVAMRNKYNGCSLRRAGIEVAIVNEGFLLRDRVPEPNARRPMRRKLGKKK